MIPPENERAGLLFWRRKIDERLKELDRQQAEREGLQHFLQWRKQRQPRRER
jgi:hypothetical protein